MPRKPDPLDVISIDYETYYCSAKKAEKLGISPCSVADLGIMAYMAHPDFEAYLVAIVGRGIYKHIRYVGHPDEFDWSKLNGKHLIAHNAGFDQPIADGFLAKAGAKAAKWDCTADLAAFHGYPRSLSGAMKELFGQFVSKQVRNDMDGVRWETLPDFKKAEVIRYADSDSVNCLRIWEKLSPTWPEHEREISRLNRLMGHTGLAVDWDLACRNHQILQARLDELEKEIPWVGEAGDDGKIMTPASRKAFTAACREANIPEPASKAKDDPRWLEWLKEYATGADCRAPFAKAISEWGSINKMSKFYERLFDRARGPGISYDSLYFGTHTGRNAGAGGVNFLNLNKYPVCGTTVRNVFIPSTDNIFVHADLSQIEPRFLAWRIGDTEFLDLCRSGASPYVAHGILTGSVPADRATSFPDEENKEEALVYACLKQELLSLQYMTGYKGYHETLLDYGLPSTLEKAEETRRRFHEVRPRVAQHGNYLDSVVRTQLLQGLRPCTIPLAVPGRSLKYWNVYAIQDRDFGKPSLRGVTDLTRKTAPEKMSNLWVGLLIENETQANSRDGYWDMALRANNRIRLLGGKLVLSVYDEVVFDTPRKHAEECKAIVEQEFSTAPVWAPGLPVATKAKFLERYKK